MAAPNATLAVFGAVLDWGLLQCALLILLMENHLMKLTRIALCLLLACALPGAIATTLICPDLASAVQVGACPTEAQLKYTFTGYCSDPAKAYAGETDVCTDFQRYRQMKNTAMWESADGVFDAYVSCELPKERLLRAKVTGFKVVKKGKQTQLICSYPEGVNFIHRTREECTLDNSVDCAANPEACQASCH